MLSMAVINQPIKSLPFCSGSELSRAQRAYGGNGEILMNPSDQSRLCNHNFKVKFGNLKSSYASAKNLV